MQKHTSFSSLAVLLLSVAAFSTPSLALASRDVADQADNKADVVSVDKDPAPASKDMIVQDGNGAMNEAAAPAATQSDDTEVDAITDHKDNKDEGDTLVAKDITHDDMTDDSDKNMASGENDAVKNS